MKCSANSKSRVTNGGPLLLLHQFKSLIVIMARGLEFLLSVLFTTSPCLLCSQPHTVPALGFPLDFHRDLHLQMLSNRVSFRHHCSFRLLPTCTPCDYETDHSSQSCQVRNLDTVILSSLTFYLWQPSNPSPPIFHSKYF